MPKSFFKTAPAGTREDFTGTIGYKFTPNRNLRVTHLGRACSTALTGVLTHQMAIWNEAGSALITSVVTISTSSPFDPVGLRYERISAPVTLLAGTAYLIGSQETLSVGNDAWKDKTTVTAGVEYEAVATVNTAQFLVGSFGAPTSASTASQAYGYCNFYYDTLRTGLRRNRQRRNTRRMFMTR